MHIASGIILFLMQLMIAISFIENQSAVNEGRLVIYEVKDDKASFPIHTIDLDKAKVLIRPEQAEGAKGKIL